MLTCIYVVIWQVICVGVDPSQKPESYTTDYRDLYISAVVTTAVIIYRTFRSILGYSHDCCYCPAPPKEEKLCSPECCKCLCGCICGDNNSWNGCFIVDGFFLFVYVVLVILALAVVGFGGHTISSILWWADYCWFECYPFKPRYTHSDPGRIVSSLVLRIWELWVWN